MMVARVAEVEFFILSLGLFLRAVRIGAVKRLLFARLLTSRKTCGAILRVASLLIKEWFAFGILWILEHMNVNPVSDFVSIACLCEVALSALEEQSGFPCEYDDCMLSILTHAEPLKRVLLDKTDYWRDRNKVLRQTYRKKYESRGMT